MWRSGSARRIDLEHPRPRPPFVEPDTGPPSAVRGHADPCKSDRSLDEAGRSFDRLTTRSSAPESLHSPVRAVPAVDGFQRPEPKPEPHLGRRPERSRENVQCARQDQFVGDIAQLPMRVLAG